MNGDRDTRATIPLRDGLRNTGRWDDNGKLISLNDPLMNRFEVELSPEESGDSLHWTDADGRQNICTHFGQIARAYLSTQTFMTMAKTLLAHSDELERCCNDRDMPLNQALRTLRDAASDMRKIPHDRTAEEFLILVAQKNRAGNRGQRHDRQTGCPTINSSTLDWVCIDFYGRTDFVFKVPDARTGGLLLPTRSGAPAEAVGAAADAIAAKALVVRLTGDANTQDPVIAGNNIVHPDFPTGSLTTAGSYNRFARVAGIYT